MEKQEPKPTTTIRVDVEWKTHLEAHGRYGERHQDILNRLMGNKWKIPTSDKDNVTYSPKDIDSRKTKAKRRVGNTTSRSHKTDSGGEGK